MNDHIERACTLCGSLLHHEDDCYSVEGCGVPPTPSPEVPRETPEERCASCGERIKHCSCGAGVYRDALAAALTRIAELEAENTQLRNPPSA